MRYRALFWWFPFLILACGEEETSTPTPPEVEPVPLPACESLDAIPPEPAIPGIPGQRGDLPDTELMDAVRTDDAVVVQGGGLRVDVDVSPFQLQVSRGDEVLLRTATAGNGFEPLAFTANHGEWSQLLVWWQYEGEDDPWDAAVEVVDACADSDRAQLVLAGSDSDGQIRLTVGPFREGTARIAAAATGDDRDLNRIAMTFEAPPGERFVGFGERFNHIDQRGRTVWNWAEEGGINPGYMADLLAPDDAPPEYAYPGGETTSYAPMPWFISNRGYGLLADVPSPTWFDLGETHEEAWRVTAWSNELSLVVFDGPTPAEVLERYTERTGRSLVPRPWMLAPWNMFVSYPQSYLTVAELFRAHDIPSSVTHEWTDLLPTGGHRGREDTIRANNDQLHDLGYKVLAYVQPRVDHDAYPELWQEGDDQGLFIQDADGSSYLTEVSLNAMNTTVFLVSFVDFTADGVDVWWHGILQEGIDLGYDGWMYDFGEYVPPDSTLADGVSGLQWHDPYPLIYQRSGHDFFQGLDDDPDDEWAPDYLYFVRSGYPGSQAWTYAMWGGDPEADWSVADGLPASVVGGINAGLSGMPVWGSDIGGFHGIFVDAPTSELLKRWMQFGAFCGLMRDITAPQILDGERVLALDEPEVTYIVRRYQKLRTQLVPYAVNTAMEAHESGLPLMRHPLLHFPDDPEVWAVEREFAFGPDLYVAPVVEEGATSRALYLPQGRWVELWADTEYDGDLEGNGSGGFRIGGIPIDGGRQVTVEAPIDEIPVFVRLGALIPMVAPDVDTFSPANPPLDVDVVTAQEREHLLHVWSFVDGTTTTTLADGSRLTATQEESAVAFTREPAGDDHELVVQLLWPADMGDPVVASDLAWVADADPLALEPGTWTFDPGRHAVALHGNPGQGTISVSTER